MVLEVTQDSDVRKPKRTASAESDTYRLSAGLRDLGNRRNGRGSNQKQRGDFKQPAGDDHASIYNNWHHESASVREPLLETKETAPALNTSPGHDGATFEHPLTHTLSSGATDFCRAAERARRSSAQEDPVERRPQRVYRPIQRGPTLRHQATIVMASPVYSHTVNPLHLGQRVRVSPRSKMTSQSQHSELYSPLSSAVVPVFMASS